MAEDSGSVRRDYRGTKGVIEDADPVASPPDERTRNERGQTGGSEVKSPRTGVRDPGPPHEGSEGEPAYGAPMDTPKPSGEKTEKEKKVKKDPLKTKPPPDKKE
jgi:hypothetical protein